MPSHSEISRAVAELELGIGAAELHGSLVGYLLGGGLITPARWLDDLLIEAPPGADPAAVRAVLDALALATHLPATDSSARLVPLLPDATLPLKQRAQALTDWCGGFLGGLGISGAAAHTNSGPVADLLAAIARIAGTRWPSASTPKADAVHFDEIVEFLETALVTLARDLPSAPLGAAPGAVRH